MIFDFIGQVAEFLSTALKKAMPTEEERHARELRRISKELEQKEKQLRDKMVPPYSRRTDVDPYD
jgi:Skp family chaperone for outer membrane proteins